MPHAITTSGLASGSVSTYHQSGQGTRDWVDAHNASLDADVPEGDKLTTVWTSAGGDESVESTRKEGESDATFIQRHKCEYMSVMFDAAPLP